MCIRDSREEVFRFIWENREPLQLGDLGYIDVQSVRPSIRIAPDGFILRETIVEYVQRLTMTAKELADDFKVKMPPGLAGWRRVSILGGGTIAVSYTHLDVYKRQGLSLRISRVGIRCFANFACKLR